MTLPDHPIGLTGLRHTGFHTDLQRMPPPGVRYYDAGPANTWVRHGPLDALSQPDARGLVHSYTLPVAEPVPVVLDLDHPYFPWLISYDAMRATVRGTVPYPPPEEFLAGPRFAAALRYFRSTRCRRIVVWSRWCAETLARTFDCPVVHSKLVHIYPAVLPRPRRIQASGRVSILFAGRGFARKGGPAVLAAFQRLRKQLDIRLTIATDSGSLSPTLARDIVEAGAGLGADLSRGSILQLYRRHDLFVMPSVLESFGMAYLEAMSFGLPVVAAQGASVPAMREIITPGTHGELVALQYDDDAPFGATVDAEGLAEVLGRLITDRERRVEYGRASHERCTAGRFALTTRNEAWSKVYSDACGAASVSAR